MTCSSVAASEPAVSEMGEDKSGAATGEGGAPAAEGEAAEKETEVSELYL